MKRVVDTLDLLNRLNDSQLYDQDISKVFSEYSIPKDITYENVFNRLFANVKPVQRTIIVKPQPFSADRSLLDIRQVLGTVSKENLDASLKKLQQIRLPDSYHSKVAELFHQQMMDCEYLIGTYLYLYRQFNTHIFNMLLTLTWGQFNCPVKPEGTECEPAEHKERRLMVNNCIVLAELFLLGDITADIFYRDILKSLLNQIDSVDTNALETINKILPIIGSNGKMNMLHEDDIMSQLKSVSDDRTKYQARYRFMLKDLVELSANGWIDKKR